VDNIRPLRGRNGADTNHVTGSPNVRVDLSKMALFYLALIDELIKPKDDVSQLLKIAARDDIAIEFASMYIPNAARKGSSRNSLRKA